MKKAIIVLTDPLSSGGSVVQTQQLKFKVNGFPVATLGDEVSCPIPLHGKTKIVEGYEKFKINGLPIALHGHKVGCGCTLVGKQCVGRVMVSKPDKVNIITDTIEKIKKYDEQFRIKDKNGNFLAGVPYFIIDPSGNEYKGITDSTGLCRRIYTKNEDELKIYIGVDALEKWNVKK